MKEFDKFDQPKLIVIDGLTYYERPYVPEVPRIKELVLFTGQIPEQRVVPQVQDDQIPHNNVEVHNDHFFDKRDGGDHPKVNFLKSIANARVEKPQNINKRFFEP